MTTTSDTTTKKPYEKPTPTPKKPYDKPKKDYEKPTPTPKDYVKPTPTPKKRTRNRSPRHLRLPLLTKKDLPQLELRDCN